MCIRDRFEHQHDNQHDEGEDVLVMAAEETAGEVADIARPCLLYTSDAADERSSVDLGGRRIIKKKKNRTTDRGARTNNTQQCTRHTQTHKTYKEERRTRLLRR